MRSSVAALIVIVSLSACSMTMRIPRSQLQADMARRFPVDIDKHLVIVTASDPTIEFLGRTDVPALGLRVRMTSASGNSQVEGASRVEGRIEYVEAEHAFYLREPRVTELALAPATGSGTLARVVDGANAHYSARLVERAARAAIEQLLRAHPIYRLDPTRSEKEAKAIRHLRHVHIDGDDLVLEVGW
jgi:hypothetical protein